MKMLKNLIVSLMTFALVFTTGVGLMSPQFVLAASLSGADKLISLGMPDALARYFVANLISVNGAGNLVAAVNSGKKFSVTVASTEEMLVDGSNVTIASNNLNVTAGNITATAGALSGLRLTTNASTGFEAVAGAGSTTSDAAALSVTKGFHQITGANGALGWKFATLAAGDVHFLMSTTAGVPKVYAPTGGTCNGGAADAACTLVTGIVAHVCVATSTTALICS